MQDLMMLHFTWHISVRCEDRLYKNENGLQQKKARGNRT